MEFWLWIIIGILLCIITGLTVRLHLLRKSALEINEGLAERLTVDTNTLISISSRDAHMCKPISTYSSESSAMNATVFSRVIWN